ncbi:MAG: helix-turn-helix transcriptional regulator [Austwickia sp.]|jgi:molybdopterin-binding protein|nr:MAG: helix-turn-helix transcriptional regulator [Austwickia sp.]
MTQLRIAEAAQLLGVSDDTVRRWVDGGRLAATSDASGRKVIDGAELARFAENLYAVAAGVTSDTHGRHDSRRSSRNHFTGLVTRVTSDLVMSQVELQCGPYRVVALISTEAVRDLGLEPGALATALVKATNVSIETPGGPRA